MSKKNLDPAGQKMLEEVITLANGDISEVTRSVLRVIKGVSEPRREYLLNELKRLANKEMTGTKKPPVVKKAPVTTRKPISRLEWLCARDHEQSMLKNVPRNDR